jgi:hypothetical protein
VARREELLEEIAGTSVSYKWNKARVVLDFEIAERNDDIDSMVAAQNFLTWPGLIWGFERYFSIKFSCTYPGDDACRQMIGGLEERDNVEALWAEFFRCHAEDERLAVQIASEIALPGGAIQGPSIQEIAGSHRFLPGVFSPTSEAYQTLCEDHQRESVDLIPFRTVWKWLSSQNGFRRGVADTPVAKALAYYSHAFGPSYAAPRFSTVVWSCAGLEAFYGDDQTKRAQQLSQKAPAFLGWDRGQAEQDLQKLYKVRSSIIHGNKAISSLVGGSDAMPEAHEREENDAKCIGVYYLLETIRACILKKKSSIQFGWVLIDSPG